MSFVDAPDRHMNTVEKLTAYRDFQAMLRGSYEAAGVALPAARRDAIESHVMSALVFNDGAPIMKGSNHVLRRKIAAVGVSPQTYFALIRAGVSRLASMDMCDSRFWAAFGVAARATDE